jgi:cyclase
MPPHAEGPRNKVRIMPVLLLREWGLEKTIRFGEGKYVGCPINAARVFNGKNADGLILLDIAATPEGRAPQLDIIRQIATESFMPLIFGGGLRSVHDVREALRAGADQVAINSAAVENPALVSAASEAFGRQCVVVSIDARRSDRGGYEVFIAGGRTATGLAPVDHARRMEEAGAGEILINAIDRDGTMEGYDLELVRAVSDAVSIPVIALGGAGSTADLARAVYEGHASAVAAGAFFLFYGKRRTVLISYPNDAALLQHFAPEHIRLKDQAIRYDTVLARL